jgi:hypothetical protein
MTSMKDLNASFSEKTGILHDGFTKSEVAGAVFEDIDHVGSGGAEIYPIPRGVFVLALVKDDPGAVAPRRYRNS